MERRGHTRRELLRGAAVLGGALLAGGCKRKEADERRAPKVLTTSHRTLGDDEYAIFAAACERLLPRDQDPGALDANVPEFLDRMLQSKAIAKMKDNFLGGLEALDRRSRGRFGKGFAEASAEQQDELIAEFKDARPGTGESRFYEMLLAFTMEGFLGDPSYGGNKDRVGWALVGFSTMEPPQGYDGLQHLEDPSKSAWKGSAGACH